MYKLFLLFFFSISLILIGIILLQSGKVLGIGNYADSGKSTLIFNSSIPNNFMRRLTAILAILFFSSNLMLVYLQNNSIKNISLENGQPSINMNNKNISTKQSGNTTK